ncbi:hypothetical protein C8Q75DRAFT_739860 [Abortiporus biennis]|nr:hypothetical protein C8Q75DRAFT_739860 [Abortiporus biennis]
MFTTSVPVDSNCGSNSCNCGARYCLSDCCCPHLLMIVYSAASASPESASAKCPNNNAVSPPSRLAP